MIQENGNIKIFHPSVQLGVRVTASTLSFYMIIFRAEESRGTFLSLTGATDGKDPSADDSSDALLSSLAVGGTDEEDERLRRTDCKTLNNWRKPRMNLSGYDQEAVQRVKHEVL